MIVAGRMRCEKERRTAVKSINPHQPSEVILEFEPQGRDAVDQAVRRARSAFRGWSATTALERGKALQSIAREVENRSEELVDLQLREIGKPIRECRAEIQRVTDIFDYYSQIILTPDGETFPTRLSGSWFMARRYPLGVVALITPWNSPTGIQAWKSAPALGYGNTVVLKPAPESSATAALLHEITAAQLPPNVLQIVLGDEATGHALVDHRDVVAISFTGSVDGGRAVAVTAAKRGAKVQCEMGGQNPSIVLADADLDVAAKTIAHAAMTCAGQKCTATSRVIVEVDVYRPFSSLLVAAIEDLEVVDPSRDSCAVGPVIRRESLDRALTAVGDADVLTGGKELDEDGFYLSPTLVRESSSSKLAREEVFAPVSVLMPAANADQAIDIANDVEYGLSAALFTNDLHRAVTLLPRLEAGLVRTNASTTGLEYYAPFGGIKASSIGPREQGLAARDFYTETRTLLLST